MSAQPASQAHVRRKAAKVLTPQADIIQRKDTLSEDPRPRSTDPTGIPANRFRLPSCCDTEQPDLVKRQERQIVQSCMNLDDFLPGFAPSWRHLISVRSVVRIYPGPLDRSESLVQLALRCPLGDRRSPPRSLPLSGHGAERASLRRRAPVRLHRDCLRATLRVGRLRRAAGGGSAVGFHWD